MAVASWEEAQDAFRKEISSIQDAARFKTTRLERLRGQAECYNIQYLKYSFEHKRKTITKVRGIQSLTKSGWNLAFTLGTTITSSFLKGHETKNSLMALNAGLRTFMESTEELGQTNWAIRLEPYLEVKPTEDIIPGERLFTYDSVLAALNELKFTAEKGARLGCFEEFISKLKRSKKLVAYAVICNSLELNSESPKKYLPVTNKEEKP